MMAEYLGVTVHIPENDPDSLAYLRAAGEGRLELQRCSDCDLLRYPAGPSCPFCMSLQSTWSPVSGNGTIYSYEIVYHPIHPAQVTRVPYPVVLVELDEQRGVPTEHDGLRVVSALVDEAGEPEQEDRVAIGARVEVVFADLGDGLGLPRFVLSADSTEGEPWRLREPSAD
jgi:uncharacterized OB-fold protein